jgi:hypothetical protein
VDQSEQHDRTLPHASATVAAVSPVLDGEDISDEISDDELAALALAADPNQPVGGDAVPILLSDGGGLLPEWYMPAPMSIGRGSRRRWILGCIVLSLVAVNGAGLCVTYGIPEIAF